MTTYEIIACPRCKRPIPTTHENIVGLTNNKVILRCECSECFDIDREDYIKMRAFMTSSIGDMALGRTTDFRYVLTNN